MIYLRAYARFNLGDDLFIREICNHYPNQEFYLIASKDYKKIFSKISNLTIMDNYHELLQQNKSDINKYLKVYHQILKEIAKKCETYLYIGGSIFMENEFTGINQLKEIKMECSYFKYSYIIGANFGPYKSTEYLNYAHYELFPSLTNISFRDLNSYKLFADLNNVRYVPDLIF